MARMRLHGSGTAATPPPPVGGYQFPTTVYTFPRLLDDGGVAANVGLANVLDYGATGNGTTNDTAAILSAINQNMTFDIQPTKPIFFQNGIYLLNDRLLRFAPSVYRPEFYIQGENETGTVLKLAAGASGYGNPAVPKAVIFQSSKTPDALGNEGYRNFVADLTIDLNGNTGAIGIDTMTHNVGSIRRVTVKGLSGGNSYCGVRNERNYPGPFLIHRLTVLGCQYGIRCVNFLYQVTVEHLNVQNQSVAGVLVDSLPTQIRGMISTQTGVNVPAVKVQGNDTGSVVIVDGVFSGNGGSAITNTGSGTLHVRNIESWAGYAHTINDNGTLVDLDPGEEYTTAPKHSLWTIPEFTLNIPIVETPESTYPAAVSWTNVADFGVVPGAGDRSGAFQAAIDSGATHLFFPPVNNNFYCFSSGVILRGNVQHILFNQANFSMNSAIAGKTLFSVQTTVPDQITLEHFAMWWTGNFPALVIEDRSPKKLIVKDFWYPTPYVTGVPVSGSLGDFYIDDAICSLVTINRPQNVYARNYNDEVGVHTRTAAGDSWFLGFKTEGQLTLVNANAGRVEWIGGLNHSAPTQTTPAFVFNNIPASIVGRTSFASPTDWNVVVQETLGAVTRQLLKASCSISDGGVRVNLYRSGTP